MPIDLYYATGSPPCRAVINVAKALGVNLNLKAVNVMAGDHKKPEFLKLNPQHTIPTLDDNGFVLWESRAIITYLVEQYGKNDSLYPKDPKKRGLVDQRLYFDLGTLYQRLTETYFPVMFFGATLDPENVKKVEEAFGFLETFLEKSSWVAGDHLTVADIALVTTVTTIEAVRFDISKYPKVSAWVKKTKAAIPEHDEVNGPGLKWFTEFYDKNTKK